MHDQDDYKPCIGYALNQRLQKYLISYLQKYKDLNLFKLYMADTGLFVTLQFKDRDFTENTIYIFIVSLLRSFKHKKTRIYFNILKEFYYKEEFKRQNQF